MALPARSADDMDEELSDEQVRELLNEAERRMRGREVQAEPTATRIKLPKLQPGDVNDAGKNYSSNELYRVAAVKKVEDPIALRQQKLEEKKASAGPDWYNLPKTNLTPELRRDLQLLKMRGVLDAKRHYKKNDSKSDVPAFSQVGTIIEGPTEYYNGRLNNKDRKKTFVEEVLAQEEDSGRFKRKYNDIQKIKTSGKKAFYKALKAKRQGKVEKR